MYRLKQEGAEMYYSAFSFCGMNELVEELKNALSVLDVDKFKVFNFEVRNFDRARQQILDTCIELRKEFDPTHVFLPSEHDTHQDHIIVHREAVRAFKDRTMLSYEMPWNNSTINTKAFFMLKQKHIEKKIIALGEYKSQMHRPYMNGQFITGLARVRGVQCGSEFAECFDVIKMIQ